jgi:hypothetical protein
MLPQHYCQRSMRCGTAHANAVLQEARGRVPEIREERELPLDDCHAILAMADRGGSGCHVAPKPKLKLLQDARDRSRAHSCCADKGTKNSEGAQRVPMIRRRDYVTDEQFARITEALGVTSAHVRQVLKDLAAAGAITLLCREGAGPRASSRPPRPCRGIYKLTTEAGLELVSMFALRKAEDRHVDIVLTIRVAAPAQ